jgi:myo-inositol 2-dehydrogenase/D-chiro-inositol 1-dehydrogenase
VRGARLAWVVDASEASRTSVQEAWSVPVYEDFEEAIARDDADVIDVVAPNSLHAQIATAAVRSGRHVLVEKPLGLSLAECDRVIASATTSGRLVFVGHEFRLSPLWGRVKAEVDHGLIGRPIACHIDLWRRSFRPGFGGWRHDAQRVGSWLLEQSIHYFDLARWYMEASGEPQTVYARGSGRSGGLAENLAAIVTFRDDTYAAFTQTAGHDQLAEIVGTDASLRLIWRGANDQGAGAEIRLEVVRGDEVAGLEIDGVASEEADLEREISAVVDSVRGLRAPHADASDGRWAVALCLAAEASMRAGTPIKVADLPR